MSDSWNKIILDIKQDIGRTANKIARGVAEVALEDLQEAHSAILDSYYGGYTPVDSYYYHNYVYGRLYSGIAHGYRRTGNLRRSILPQGIHPVGTHGFQAEVLIGPMNMDGYINSTGRVFSQEKVFDYIWNEGIRGLPPGYIGHVGGVEINTAPVGVWISGTPDAAMTEFIENWGQQRGAQVADSIAFNI